MNDARLTEFTLNSGHFKAVAGPLAHSANDCVEFFKLQCVENAHLRDPFISPLPFNQEMYDLTLESKPKVGILIETPILQVSKSVKRALSITRKALQEQGFEVVDVQITPEEYAEGRDLLIGMVATGGGPGTMRDFERSGEHTMFSVWMNFFLLSRSSCTQWIIKKLMSSIGMGRGAAMLKEFNMRNEEQFELFMKRRYEFAYKMSEKW